MAPKTEEQFKQIRENRKKLIMDTALELFATLGYHSTSISRIATGAGISKGLIYNYFNSKDELLGEILNNGMELLYEVFKGGNLETKSDFIALIDYIFKVSAENMQYWKLYFSVMIQPVVLEIFDDEVVELLLSVIEKFKNYFTIQNHANPLAEARLFAAILDGVAFHYIIEPQTYPIEDVKKVIIEKFS